MWLFFTFIAALFWGVGQIVIKKGLSNVPPLFNNVLAAIIVPALVLPYVLSHDIHYEKIISILPLTIIVAILWLAYYYIIGKGQLAFTGTIIGTAPIITVFLSFLFLNENPSVIQKVAIGLILIGTTFLALPEKGARFKLGSWFWWAVTMALIAGVCDFMIKLLITQSDLYTYLFTYAICMFIVSFLSILFDPKGRKAMPAFNLKAYAPTIIGVTIMEIAFISFHFALSDGLASIVAPVSSIYIAITAILAWLILKEKINKLHFAGIALAAIGVVLVGIS
jgi:uncharacterized membrane protein